MTVNESMQLGAFLILLGLLDLWCVWAWRDERRQRLDYLQRSAELEARLAALEAESHKLVIYPGMQPTSATEFGHMTKPRSANEVLAELKIAQPSPYSSSSDRAATAWKDHDCCEGCGG